VRLADSDRKRLASEFRFAADKMADSTDLLDQLFFFSAFYGEVARVLNLSWSAELALLHLVLNTVHQQINARVISLVSGDRVVGIAKELPSTLNRVASELANLFEAKEIDEAQFHSLLTKMSELGFVTTGNGYYLYTKGLIKL